MTLLHTLLSSGESAAVYDLGDGTILKAGTRSVAPIGNAADHDFLVWAFCRNERRAYERLQTHPDLELLVPRYFGPFEDGVLAVEPPAGKVLVAGTGLRLERLSGTEAKIGNLPDDLLTIANTVLDRIKEIVGGNPYDASAFYPGPRAAVTIIDFAHWDHIHDYLSILTRRGTLTEQHHDFVRRWLVSCPLNSLTK